MSAPRRGPGRPRTDKTLKADGRTGEQERDAPSLPVVEVDLRQSPEYAAAMAAHGTAEHIRPVGFATDDEDIDGDGDEQDEESPDRSGRHVTSAIPHTNPDVVDSITAVGFDDGTTYQVKGGKLAGSGTSDKPDAEKAAVDADAAKPGAKPDLPDKA